MLTNILTSWKFPLFQKDSYRNKDFKIVTMLSCVPRDELPDVYVFLAYKSNV